MFFFAQIWWFGQNVDKPKIASKWLLLPVYGTLDRGQGFKIKTLSDETNIYNICLRNSELVGGVER